MKSSQHSCLEFGELVKCKGCRCDTTQEVWYECYTGIIGIYAMSLKHSQCAELTKMKYLVNVYLFFKFTFLFQGRFDLHQPLYECHMCQRQWAPDSKDLFRSGYWPASVSNTTLYTLDLLSSFQELKVIAPGFSRQAFAKLLEHRTKCGGRVSVIVLYIITS